MSDIYEYAKKMEKDGEAFYRDLAAGSSAPGLKRIFEMLADEEVGHYKLFSEMAKHNKAGVTDSPFLDNVRNVFEKIREEKPFGDLDASQAELYRKAQGLEKESEDFYREKAAQVDSAQRGVFLRIAAQEKRHFQILENMIQLVSRPESWLENAEFHHLEDY